MSNYLCLQGEGQTALHIAAAEGDETLVKYFYGVRANASIADNQGKYIDRTRVDVFYSPTSGAREIK